MKQGVNLERFCKDEVIQVSKGIRTSFIKPPGKREVIVSIKGIKYNTPDGVILEYLSKFGDIVSNEVIYERRPFQRDDNWN